MALVKGTNCGFVTVAPTADPAGSLLTVDSYASAFRDTSPSDASSISEIGWWCDEQSNASNGEVGLYNHDAGNNRPGDLLFSTTFVKAENFQGWLTTTVDWAIDPDTIYWIAVQVDDTVTATRSNYAVDAGEHWQYKSGATLPDPFGVPAEGDQTLLSAYYAVYSAGGTNCQINIGDVWKVVPAMKINIGDTWKDVASAKINIGDAWKTIF